MRIYVACLLLNCGLLTAVSAEPVSFVRQIAPILLDNCVSCHGPKKAEGGYRLDTFAQLSRAGDSGIAPLEIASDEKHTELLRRLQTDDAAERMPAEREPLLASDIELFSRWEAEGRLFDGGDPNALLFEIVPPRSYPTSPQKYAAAIPITALTFTPDGTQLVASGYHELTVWDANSGKLLKRIGNLPERILSFDWSTDGQRLAVAGGSPSSVGEVRLIDWGSGELLTSFGRAGDVVQAVRFQPTGDLVATGNSDGTLRWFATADWKPVRSVASHADIIYDVAWSRDGTRLGSASRDKTAKVFVVESAELISTYSGHGEAVHVILLNEGDKEVTTAGADRKLHRWQIEDGKNLAKVDLPGVPTRAILDGPNAWLSLTDRTARQFELGTTKLTSQLSGHAAWLSAIAISSTSGKVATGSLDGEVRLWNLSDSTQLHHWTAIP